MMLKVVFDVVSLVTGYLPMFTGHLVQGLFLHTIEKEDPNLSKQLHDVNAIRPYAVIPLHPMGFKKRLKSGMWEIEAGKSYRFGFSILDERLEKTIMDILLSVVDGNLKLGVLDFHVHQINFNKLSMEELLREELKKKHDDNIIRFKFLTPAQFKEKAKNYPTILPVPRLVFTNLARIWNTFSEVRVYLEDFKEWVEKNVYVREYKIVTKEVDIGKAEKIVGFKGHVGFLIKDEKYKGWLYVLSRFAEFSNVGVKRTRGLGVVRLLRYLRKLDISSPHNY